MKTFNRKTFSICIFLAVVFMIVGTAAATKVSNDSSFKFISVDHGPAVKFPAQGVNSGTDHPVITIGKGLYFNGTDIHTGPEYT